MSIVIQEIHRERMFNVMFPIIFINKEGERDKAMHLVQNLSEYLAYDMIKTIEDVYEFGSSGATLEIPNAETENDEINVRLAHSDNLLVFTHRKQVDSQYSFILDERDARELAGQLSLILNNPKMYHNVLLGES